MSKNLQIEKKFSTSCERVKMIDMHPKEPLIICALYSGQVTLWNYDTKALVKSFEIIDQPIRCVKFIVRLQSFACGADDMQIRAYNYNTMERTTIFVAHDDYIRSLAVHDQLPLMLSSSDDMRIKAWDWSKDWACTMVFEGHQHYVMQIAFNPKEPMTFASASLDQTVKVWNINNPEPFFSLTGHEDAVNCVEYYPKGDKPYLVSGADDHTIKVWDYQTRACIQTLTFHNNNINFVFFHPDVPLLFSGGEDRIIGVVNTQTWRQEATLNYGLERAWSVAARPNTNAVAIGFDQGLVVLKVGSDLPILSLDCNGKLYQAIGNEVRRTDIKNIPAETADGESLRFGTKDLGSTESAPSQILVGPSGQFITVVTESKEYTIYSSLAWRPKAFGQCTAFAWGLESGSYAALEGDNVLKTFKAFKPMESIKLPENSDMLFGGPLLGVRSPSAVTFYDWEKLRVVRRIEGFPSIVTWSDSNELVALVLETGFYVLKLNTESVNNALATGQGIDPREGLEDAFDVIEEVEEKVRQAAWVGDCLTFINQNDRLNYYIGGEVTNIAVVSRQTYLLGFLQKENRLFCIDRDNNISSYLLHVSVIEYKTAIVREDMEAAAEILPRIPDCARHKVAQFLQSRGHLEIALEVTPEDDHRFDLAIQLSRIEVALEVCKRIPSSVRWKQIGDLALENALFDTAEEAMINSGDYNGLLLLHTSTGNTDGLRQLYKLSREKGKSNVTFTCAHLLADHSAATEALLDTGRFADAAFYARTYCHEMVDDIVVRWKNSVAGLPRVRDSIADPASFPNLFPNMADYFEKKKGGSPKAQPPATAGKPSSPTQSAPRETTPQTSITAASPELPKEASSARGINDHQGAVLSPKEPTSSPAGSIPRPANINTTLPHEAGPSPTSEETPLIVRATLAAAAAPVHQKRLAYDDNAADGGLRTPPSTPVVAFGEVAAARAKSAFVDPTIQEALQKHTENISPKTTAAQAAPERKIDAAADHGTAPSPPRFAPPSMLSGAMGAASAHPSSAAAQAAADIDDLMNDDWNE